MSINGVVMDSERMPLPINSLEKYKVVLKGIDLSLQTGTGYPGTSNSYYGTGTIILTNYRLIFISNPSLPLFDSFMVTWNKIDQGRLSQPGRLWRWLRLGSTSFESTVYPLEDEHALVGVARLCLTSKQTEDVQAIWKTVKESRWTGNLDPENTAEPPPPYPLRESDERSPPPNYQEALALNGESTT